MRLTLTVLCIAVCTSMASAQTQSEQKQPPDSQHNTGRTVMPDDNQGQLQPQGRTNQHRQRWRARGKSPRAVSARHAACARWFLKDHR